MKSLLTLCCLFGLIIINAQETIPVDEDGFTLIATDNNENIFYIKTENADRNSLNDKITSATFWIKQLEPEKIIKGKNGKLKKIAGNKILQFFTCSCLDKELMLEEIHIYDSKGKVLKNTVYSDNVKSYSRAIPGSLGRTFLNGVCGINE